MKYRISIIGMHCHGCVNLIKMSLEEDNTFQEIKVEEGRAEFTSSLEEQALQHTLQNIFTGLPGYGYTNLIKLD